MKKQSKNVVKRAVHIIMFGLLSAFGVHAQMAELRPTPPEILTVTNNLRSINVKMKPVTIDNLDEVQYHGLLVTNLSVSLQEAYKAAGTNDGPVITTDAAAPTETINMSLGDKSIERYFLAVASSGVVQDGPHERGTHFFRLETVC